MSDRTKDLILKTVLVIGFILLLMVFPGCFFLVYLVPNEELNYLIFNTILFSFFGVGILFMILLPIFGGLKQKPVKADKLSLDVKSYNQLFKYLKSTLLEKGYIEQSKKKILNDSDIVLFLRKSELHKINCFTIINTSELSEEIIEKANDTITKILMEYYGAKTIRDSVDMISLFCVDRITPSFQKLVNSNMQQGLKNGRLVVGVSFGGKRMYIANQTEGFAIAKYKSLRKEFIEIMNLKK